MQRPSWPRLIQWISSTCSPSAGSVSSRIAVTTTRLPLLRAAAATRNGNRPFPAMSPRGPADSLPPSGVVGVIPVGASPSLDDDASPRRLDELDEDADLGAHRFGLETLDRRLERKAALGEGPERRTNATDGLPVEAP